VKTDSKQTRQRLIRQIVAGGSMHTQDALVAELKAREISVTQATVSRDMVELGLVRAAVGGKVVYTLPGTVMANDSGAARRRLAHLLGDVPLAFSDSAYLLIVRTAPGMANMICATLDACAFPEVVGTVAGDDTIFIALRSAEDRNVVHGYLTNIGIESSGDTSL
jgi:transcriptional regulator of arginine metabolism